MANSNNICTRFINYVAVLILAFLSSSVFAAGGSFGGGGAGGSWSPPACTTSYYVSDFLTWQNPKSASTPDEACLLSVQARNNLITSNANPSYRYTHVSNTDATCVMKRTDGYG